MDTNQATDLNDIILIHNFTLGAIRNFIEKIKVNQWVYSDKSLYTNNDLNWWCAVVATFIKTSETVGEKILQSIVRAFRQVWKWMRWTFAKAFLAQRNNPNAVHAQNLEYEWMKELRFLEPYIEVGEADQIDFNLEVGPFGTLCGLESPCHLIYRGPAEPESSMPCLSVRLCAPSIGITNSYEATSSRSQLADLFSPGEASRQQINLSTSTSQLIDYSPLNNTFEPGPTSTPFVCVNTPNPEGLNESCESCIFVHQADSTNNTTINYCDPSTSQQRGETSPTDFLKQGGALSVPNEPQLIDSSRSAARQNTPSDGGLHQTFVPRDFIMSLLPRLKDLSPEANKEKKYLMIKALFDVLK